jgi:very-short-patch-repair endonuclease
LTTIQSLSISDETAVLEILQKESYPISVKDVRRKLKRVGLDYPEYLILRSLRSMLSSGSIRYKAGRWMTSELFDQVQASQAGYVPINVNGPELSALGESAKIETIDGEFQETGFTGADESEESSNINNVGRWGTFRKLLKYYSECIRSEEGADASGFISDLGKRYIFINGLGNWYPKTGEKWSYVIPLGPQVADFVQNLSKNADDNVVVLGYPIEAVHIKKQGEPDTRLIRPVFQYILNADFTKSSITLNTSDAQPEISMGWMKYSFKGYSEQHHFLSSCGLLNQPRPSDEPLGFNSQDSRPDLDSLAHTLSAFMSRRVKEPLNSRSVNAHTLPSGFETGIYNKAVIMIGSRTKYTQTLLKELNTISSQPDEVLEQTSLKYLFQNEVKLSLDNDPDPIPHEASVAEVLPLNSEQRESVSALLSNGISVVTGPPGTGKSQVIIGAIANGRFQDQSILFASRNHKAIDAVVGRAIDENGKPSIIRTNSKEDSSLKYTFRNAISDLLSTDIDLQVRDVYNRRLAKLNKLLNKRGEYSKTADQIRLLRDQIGELEETVAWLTEELSQDTLDGLENNYKQYSPSQLDRVKQLIFDISKIIDGGNTDSWLKAFRVWLKLRSHWKIARKIYTKVAGSAEISRFPPLRHKDFSKFPGKILEDICDFISSEQQLEPLESALKDEPELSEIVFEIRELSKDIEKRAKELLSLNLHSRGGLVPGNGIQQQMASLNVALKTQNRGFESDSQRIEVEQLLKKTTPLLLDNFPCWAVTNLSAGSRIPLAPGIFDVIILDEASQCDIASAIPLLYRAKRAAVVGDPHQLKHVSNLSVGKDSLLRRRAGLTELKDQRFSYRETSLYDLFAQTNSVSPHLLRETYRSCDEIAEYSNRSFYGGMLRVATDCKSINTPNGMKSGIHWTEVESTIRSAGKSGCVSEAEIEAVYKLVITILTENNFKGTVGIVTPFRMQANRLQDKIFDGNIPYDKLSSAKVVIDTAHGFQGDERDVMIFSLCSGPDMPRGSLWSVTENGNLFNVAASRARAVLHVVGNRNWAMKCGVEHIVQLAQPPKKRSEINVEGPWAPHESPWEEILYKALHEKGIEAIPQYPVVGRRLDMALVDEKSGLKIDIEVDSDRFHRNPDGSRKKDDTWRDIYLMSMGWKVMRFWVYQLREDMDKCVSEIAAVWRNYE